MKATNEAIKHFIPNPKNNSTEISNNLSTDSLDTLKLKMRSLPELEPTPKSFFSHIASFWGEYSWWLKALILFTITLPIIVVGVYFQMPVLFGVALGVAGVYIGVSLLLDTRYNIEERLQNSFIQKTNALLQFVDGQLNLIWRLGRDSYAELGNATIQSQQLVTKVQSLSLENDQFKTKTSSMEEKLLNLTELNANLEKTIHQQQQYIREITSNNNDKFLTTLITHINANQAQYACNQNYFGAHHNQVNTHPTQFNTYPSPYIQRNFFEKGKDFNNDGDLDNSFKIAYPEKK